MVPARHGACPWVRSLTSCPIYCPVHLLEAAGLHPFRTIPFGNDPGAKSSSQLGDALVSARGISDYCCKPQLLEAVLEQRGSNIERKGEAAPFGGGEFDT